jgi:hypothetical protein
MKKKNPKKDSQRQKIATKRALYEKSRKQKAKSKRRPSPPKEI